MSTDFQKKSQTSLQQRLTEVTARLDKLKGRLARAKGHVLASQKNPLSKTQLRELELQEAIHEMQVHQIEIEMQNRELRHTQSELELSRDLYAELYDFAPVGYLDLDDNGIIRNINLTGTEILRGKRSVIIGKPFSLYLSDSSRLRFTERLRACTKTNERQTLALEVRCQEKQTIPVELTMIRATFPDHRNPVCRATFTDITERRRAEAERVELLRREQAARAEAEAERDFVRNVGTLAPMMIGILSGPDHRLKWLNNAAFRQTGIPPHFVGQPFKKLLPKVHDQIGTALDHVYSAHDPLTVGEISFKFGLGPERWLHVALAPLPMKDGKPTGIVLMALDVTESRAALEILRQSEESLEARVKERTTELDKAIKSLQEEMAQRKHAQEARQKLFRTLASTQENERRYISRELHDQMGQHLTALSIGLKTLQSSLRDEAGRKQLRDLQKLADDIGSQVHRIACELRPTALDDLGLQATLSNYLEEWSDRFGITADFHPDAAGAGRLPSEIETTVYRIVQEALTNVVKHAGASHLSVILTRNDGELVTIIEDDGQGFDPDKVSLADSERPRLGLAGIRERVALAGGTFQVESSSGQGTTLFARIPLPHTLNANHQ